MLSAFGALHPGALRVKLGPCVIAGVVVLAFFATPLGPLRLANESSSSLAATGEPNSSVAWRLKKWKTLIPAWEEAPGLRPRPRHDHDHDHDHDQRKHVRESIEQPADPQRIRPLPRRDRHRWSDDSACSPHDPDAEPSPQQESAGHAGCRRL